jgi:hypothetical protein
VEGVGKSIFMKAIALAVTVLLDKMFPLYLYVEETDTKWTSLLDLLKEAFPNGDSFNSAPDFIENLNRFQKTEVVFLVDEFQRYFRRFNRDSFLGLTMAQTMADVSRCCGTYGIISGSSTQMRSFLFRKPYGSLDEEE